MTDSSVEIWNIEQAESRGWNAMVAEHPLGCVYHHTAFGKVIASTFPHAKPHYLALLDRSGHLTGGIVLFLVRSWLTGTRLVSIPWACYGDPMVGSAAECETLFQAILEFAGRVKASYVEIKACHSTRFLTNTGPLVPVYNSKRHTLDLTVGLDRIWKGLHESSVRRKIKRALQNDIRIRLASSEQEVSAFYQIFIEHRRRLGLPPQRPAYFRNIWQFMAPHGLARLWLAYQKDRLVGGECGFLFKGTIVLVYIGVEEALYRDGVGQYLTWAPIVAASEEGLKVVDLGKTPAHDDGLLFHKRHWGGVESEAPAFYYPRAMGVSSQESEWTLSYRALRTFWRTAPPALSRVASGFFYKHMG